MKRTSLVVKLDNSLQKELKALGPSESKAISIKDYLKERKHVRHRKEVYR